MKNIILVHGAWLGGWCWDAVARELVADGHNVSAPDLPAHGGDTTSVSGATLSDYADRSTGWRHSNLCSSDRRVPAG